MARRFFRHGELPLVLLALVAERPMHGYDLMAELARLFAPYYRPSPGSVYPAVEALEAEGLIVPTINSDVPRVYRLTSLGQQALDKRRNALAALELRTGVRVGERDTIDAVLDRFASRVRSLAGQVGPDVLERTLDRVLDDIKKTVVNKQVSEEAR